MRTIAALADPAAHAVLADALADWLPGQRWFAGKARVLAGVDVADVLVLDDDGGTTVLDVVVDVAFADGHAERYQVPLTEPDPDTDGRWIAVTAADAVLADATVVPAAARLLAAATLSPARRESATGATVAGAPVDGGDAALGPPRRMTAEQSNTSVVFGDALILKVFRRLEPGLNPDVEVTRALTEAGFEHVPAQRGALLLSARGGDETALAVLADYVGGGRDGWELAADEVVRLSRSGVDCALADPALLDALDALGRAVAGMHVALRRAFGARGADAGAARSWGAAMRDQAEAVLATAERLAGDATRVVVDRRADLLRRLDTLLAAATAGPLVRTHGDLHLGQVLLDPERRWQILDFEGEPLRSLAERRAPHAALRDVAGMLRSFDYAAATVLVDGRIPEAAAAWRDNARQRFLDGYLGTAGDEVLPADPAAVRAQLDLFELDKAVYELGYELANRPTWVPIPVGGILRVLDRPSPGTRPA